jgi:hypothetical protein
LRGSVLNSKSEFSCCRIPRLVIDESWKSERAKNMEQEEKRQKEWEKVGANGETLISEGNNKRERVMEKEKGGRKKKLKYEIMGEEWGLETVKVGKRNRVREPKKDMVEHGDSQDKKMTGKKIQTLLNVLTGGDWICDGIMRDVRERAWMTIMVNQSEREREEERTRQENMEAERQRQEDSDRKGWQSELEEGSLGTEAEWLAW